MSALPPPFTVVKSGYLGTVGLFVGPHQQQLKKDLTFEG
jgi:hypothetical protein